MSTTFVDRTDMQHRLFAELSRMFGQEVPLYDKSLLVNRACNRAVCDLLAVVHPGFSITDELIEKTSGERHGAIRIGRPDEYRWIGRFFACFAMEPHNFYDMANVGAKSQPIIATAFRSTINPEHRVFTSLLLTDYFDDATKQRIEALLATRQVFSDAAKALIEKAEAQGGLDRHDADSLIRAGADHIFKWTGQARDHDLYKHLCDAGFKIAADIACFRSHHLNHLTPNTFCMDLYTAAMRFCMGESDEAMLRNRAMVSLTRLAARSDAHAMRLLFRHLTPDAIAAFGRADATPADIARLVNAFAERLKQPDLDLSRLPHAGFKDSTEGPSEDTPVLLRQDAYKALTEPVTFTNPDGAALDTVHTARFGEIEQRGYATTPKGRTLYDDCLAEVEKAKAADPGLVTRDFDTYERMYAAAFDRFPKTLPELVAAGLVHARYEPTRAGIDAAGSISTTDLTRLIADGLVRFEGLRYEDFLPVSAAGIFASNLNQYGTRTTAAEKPVYTQADLEEILGRPIVDAASVYRGLEAESLLRTYERLGLLDGLDTEARRTLEADAAALGAHALAAG
ncbi:MAG: DUF1338 family protein [Phycisphaerales bacterium]|nr:VOC family protein [Planctomycetota bacterium]MCH8509729.1 DUF1338 family protein [Phycisphaerales bacterium]